MVLPWAALLTSPPTLISLSPVAHLVFLCAAMLREKHKTLLYRLCLLWNGASQGHCCIVVVQGEAYRIASVLAPSREGYAS